MKGYLSLCETRAEWAVLLRAVRRALTDNASDISEAKRKHDTASALILAAAGADFAMLEKKLIEYGEYMGWDSEA